MSLGVESISVIVLVCNACGEPWEGQGSPAICPKCRTISFAIAVEKNTIGKQGRSAKMTTGEAMKQFISVCADKQDWIRLDALNGWASGIDGYYIKENLGARYAEVRAFPAKYDSILEELRAELEKVGIEYPSYQLEDVRESAGSFIEHEINSQCGRYFRQDITRRIQEAKDAEKKMLYLYAKYPRTSQDKTISSTDMHPEVWQGLFEASFGPVLGSSAIDVLVWFNVCNLFSEKGRADRWWHYFVPKYATQIVDNVAEYTGVPQTANAKSYIADLVSEDNIPRLALLEMILGQSGNRYWISDWHIKESFELLHPAMFEKYSKSVVGFMAKTEHEFYFCPFNKGELLTEMLEAKKHMVEPLVNIFSRLRDKVGTGDIDFQEKLAAYAGFVNLGGKRTVYFVLTPWVAPPQLWGSTDALQQLPWIRHGRTPCVILTINKLNPDFMKAIQKEGYQNICLITAERATNSLGTYLFGDKGEPFDELMGVLEGLGYQLTDMTRSFRETWYPLVEDAVVEFAQTKFGWQELKNMVDLRRISLPSSEQNKEGRTRALIRAEGLDNFARRIGYPFLSFEVADRHTVEIIVTDEKGEPITNAKVSVGSSSNSTGGDGHATFPTLSSGKHRVTVTASHFRPYEGSISIPQDSERTIHLVAEKALAEALVSILVIDESSHPVEGVLVNLGSVSNMTDPSGATEFQLPAGTYQLNLAKDGYSSISKSIEVLNTVQFNYTLSKISVPTYSITFPPYASGDSLVFGEGHLKDRIALGFEVGKKLTTESVITWDIHSVDQPFICSFQQIGMGKSTLANCIMLQAVFQSIPVVVFDPKPDYLASVMPVSKTIDRFPDYRDPIEERFRAVGQDMRGFDLSRPYEFRHEGRGMRLLYRIYSFSEGIGRLGGRPLKVPLVILPPRSEPNFRVMCDSIATSLATVLHPQWQQKAYNTTLSDIFQRFREEHPDRDYLLPNDLKAELQRDAAVCTTKKEQTRLDNLATALQGYYTAQSWMYAQTDSEVAKVEELVQNPNYLDGDHTTVTVSILDIQRLPQEKRNPARMNYVSNICGYLYNLATRRRSSRPAQFLVVMDEAANYLPDPTDQFNNTLTLIRQGRSLGIRVWLVAQAPGQIEIQARNQAFRMVLSQIPAHAIRPELTRWQPDEAWTEKLGATGKGLALIIDGSTSKEGGKLCHVFTTPQTVDLLSLEQVLRLIQ
jgi:hypothetical protein